MLNTLIRLIDVCLVGLGRFVAIFVLGMIALIVIEMTARSAFGLSLPWAHELSTWLLTAFVFLGGPYALIRGQFVRVDVLYIKYPIRTKAIIDSVFSTLLMALFAGTLIWRGSELFLSSFMMDERSATGAWGGPIWAVKVMVPLGSTLLCIAWLSHILKLWRDVFAESHIAKENPGKTESGLGT